MNVRSSKDWGEIAGLIAAGELESYTGLVALATEAEEMVDMARGIAATAGSKLQELAELGYAGRTPSVYAGVAPGVFEAAAYEFLKIVEPETEPEDLVP